ncbi:adhesion G-protein coupled receptor G1-like isoform X2 [Lepisosteus oculatus]|uniref:adhesion G-protein coupled receptor G1-like isoform X2 n=1 Tax=Lepisosteus oculatus TaxID=7918 RepID=UPI0035F50C8D
MWNYSYFIVISLLSTVLREEQQEEPCDIHKKDFKCKKNKCIWSRKYEKNIAQCLNGSRASKSQGRPMVHFLAVENKAVDLFITPDYEFKENGTEGHEVYVPVEVFHKASEHMKQAKTSNWVVITVFNDTLLFQNSEQDEILENTVIGVTVGSDPILNLTDRVRVAFKHNNETRNGSCVYWEEDDDDASYEDVTTKYNATMEFAGNWSEKGCETNKTNNAFICNCNHLSFFAILMKAETPHSLDETNTQALQYITYIASGSSALFTAITIALYFLFWKRRAEKSLAVHVHLSGSLFLLHLLFLLSVALAQGSSEGLCLALGLLLHWALLCCFTWMAIEGFHLYMLLVKVYNIYVHRYLLKLSFVGWGVPLVVVTACAAAQKYGRYRIQGEGALNSTYMCWIQDRTVNYVTITAYFGMIFLFNAVMLGIAVVKMRRLRRSRMHREGSWWKDCMTVLGLGCVLGLPWALAFFAYGPLELPVFYIFTILNSFQGLFLFLCLLALARQSYKDGSSSGPGSSAHT